MGGGVVVIGRMGWRCGEGGHDRVSNKRWMRKTCMSSNREKRRANREPRPPRGGAPMHRKRMERRTCWMVALSKAQGSLRGASLWEWPRKNGYSDPGQGPDPPLMPLWFRRGIETWGGGDVLEPGIPRRSEDVPFALSKRSDRTWDKTNRSV